MQAPAVRSLRGLMRPLRDPANIAALAVGTALQLLFAAAFTQGNIDRLYGIPGAISILVVVAVAIRGGAVVGALLGAIGAAAQALVAASQLEEPLLLHGAPLVLSWLVVGLVVGLAADRYRARLADTTARQLQAQENVVALQRRLIASLAPQAPRVRDPRLRVLMRYQPGERDIDLGGDFLDVLETPDGALSLLVGDVSGHGPAEAALGAQLRAAWRALVADGAGPGAALASLERLIALDGADGRFATAVTATVSPDRRTVTVASAGHPPPLLIDADGRPRRLAPAEIGPALGVGVGDAQWQEGATDAPEEFALLLYTDGVFEGRGDGAGSARMGERGLLELLDGVRPRGLDEARVDDLIAAIRTRNGGPLADDVALIVVAVGAG
jgi:serine phosphatase RsbU (regulator of sigma subunit)